VTPCHSCTHGRRVLHRAECTRATGTDPAEEPVLRWLERVGVEIGDAADGLPVGWPVCPGFAKQQTEVKR
jgi:hypothetical protein